MAWRADTRTPTRPENCGRTCSPVAGRSARCPTSGCGWRTTTPPTRPPRTGSTRRSAAVIEGYEFDRVEVPGRRQHLPLDRPDALAGAGHRRPGAGRRRLRRRRGPARDEHRRGHRQHPDRRVQPRQRHAAALAVRPAHRRAPRCASRAGTTTRSRPSSTSWRPATRRRSRAIDEDTLAGGLSNTIAGRICNYFDLNGGGYTVDGACSSSLLSVATACNALADGDLDVAIAGGVDLSHRPVRGDRLRQDRRAGHRRDAGLRPATPTGSGPARAAAWSC